ncbi:hypothetical protein [uncultured Mediterranean phage uvMED]|nr:hypothetical protein [uncultured Mediterranean phage uvMED]
MLRLARTLTLGAIRGIGLNPIKTQVNDFKARVIADGGVFEAKACLEAQLNKLNNIA